MKIWQLVIMDYNISVKLLATFTLIALPALVRASPAEERPDDRIQILEKVQELFGARANFAANRLDSFFATERADDEFGRSRIRIRSQFLLRERAVSELNNQYRINLKLPHLEQRFRYEYYRDRNKEKAAEEKNERPVLSAEEKERLKRNRLRENWIFNSDVGVSAAIPPRLITRARVRRNFETGTLIHRFAEQLTYVTDESGLVEETSIDSDHSINEDLIFRFVNYKRWRVLEKELFTNHGPTLLHRVTEDDAFNYGATLQNVYQEGTWFLSNYRLAVNYRRNLYHQWIYLDVIPGLDFPKVWSFRRTPFITFQLEVLFGGS
jgi:hypothetical protein